MDGNGEGRKGCGLERRGWGKQTLLAGARGCRRIGPAREPCVAQAALQRHSLSRVSSKHTLLSGRPLLGHRARSEGLATLPRPTPTEPWGSVNLLIHPTNLGAPAFWHWHHSSGGGPGRRGGVTPWGRLQEPRQVQQALLSGGQLDIPHLPGDTLLDPVSMIPALGEGCLTTHLIWGSGSHAMAKCPF